MYASHSKLVIQMEIQRRSSLELKTNGIKTSGDPSSLTNETKLNEYMQM